MSDNPAHHLAAAADNVRAFTNASSAPGAGWESPADAYTALGSLAYLVGILGRAVEQSTGPVRDVYEDGRLRAGGGREPEEGYTELRKARETALEAASALSTAVQDIHTITGHFSAAPADPKPADDDTSSLSTDW